MVEKKPVKTLVLLRESRGGIREHIRCLAKYFDPKEIKLTVCGTADRRLTAELRRMRVRFIPIPGGISLRALLALWRILRREEFDLLHSHGFRSCFLAALAGFLAGLKSHICSIHTLLPANTFQSPMGWLKKWVLLWSLHRMKCIVAVSQVVKENIQFHFPFLTPRIHVIYNGIDLSRLQPAISPGMLATTLGFDSTFPLIGVVARLSPEKGVEHFLKAAKLLLEQGIVAEFIVVGDGPERPRLEEMAHHLGITGNVRFLGERSDVPQLLSLFSVLVIPSLLEAFPLIALEAAMMGVPIVASEVGGIGEGINKDLATFVPRGDSQAIAEAVLKVLKEVPETSDELEELAEEVAIEQPTSTGQDALYAPVRASSLPTYDISGTTFELVEDTNSPRSRARRRLRERFSAEKMAVEFIKLYCDLAA